MIFSIEHKNLSCLGRQKRFLCWRSGRDLNPRAAFDGNTISSRARYDHFDTTPYSVSTALSSRFAQALSCDSDMYYNRYSPFVKYFLKISFYFFRPTVHLGQMVPRRTDWGIQECPGVGSAPKFVLMERQSQI